MHTQCGFACHTGLNQSYGGSLPTNLFCAERCQRRFISLCAKHHKARLHSGHNCSCSVLLLLLLLCLRYVGEEDPLSLITEFVTGYSQKGQLSSTEMEILPDLINLRIFSNVIYFTGRCVGGCGGVDMCYVWFKPLSQDKDTELLPCGKQSHCSLASFTSAVHAWYSKGSDSCCSLPVESLTRS